LFFIVFGGLMDFLRFQSITGGKNLLLSWWVVWAFLAAFKVSFKTFLYNFPTKIIKSETLCSVGKTFKNARLFQHEKLIMLYKTMNGETIKKSVPKNKTIFHKISSAQLKFEKNSWIKFVARKNNWKSIKKFFYGYFSWNQKRICLFLIEISLRNTWKVYGE
jgi:predicted GH43/DUF377 family glycosyl hydrolase